MSNRTIAIQYNSHFLNFSQFHNYKPPSCSSKVTDGVMKHLVSLVFCNPEDTLQFFRDCIFYSCSSFSSSSLCIHSGTSTSPQNPMQPTIEENTSAKPISCSFTFSINFFFSKILCLPPIYIFLECVIE